MDRWQENKAVIKGKTKSTTSQRFDYKHQAKKVSSTFKEASQVQGVIHQ